MFYFRQPFEDFTKITQKLIHFLFIFVHFRHFKVFAVNNQLDSYRIVFGVSSSANPEKMGSPTSQMAEISSKKHTVMTWDQVIRRPH